MQDDLKNTKKIWWTNTSQNQVANLTVCYGAQVNVSSVSQRLAI